MPKMPLKDARQRFATLEDSPEKCLPVGSLVYNPWATGQAHATVYQVIKHVPPGSKVGRQYIPLYRWKKMPKGTPRYTETISNVWRTQIQARLILSPELPRKEKQAKTTFPSGLLFPADLVNLCSLRLKLDQLITDAVHLSGGYTKEDNTFEEVQEAHD